MVDIYGVEQKFLSSTAGERCTVLGRCALCHLAPSLGQTPRDVERWCLKPRRLKLASPPAGGSHWGVERQSLIGSAPRRLSGGQAREGSYTECWAPSNADAGRRRTLRASPGGRHGRAAHSSLNDGRRRTLRRGRALRRGRVLRRGRALRGDERCAVERCLSGDGCLSGDVLD